MVLTSSSFLICRGIVQRHTDIEDHFEFDFERLENYLVSINQQLAEHKTLLHDAVSEWKYKDDVEKRATLQTTVEANCLDINLIKDILFEERDNNPAALHTGAASTTHNDVKMLRGEIEHLKATIRRLELQRAEEFEIISRIKRNERAHFSLQSEFYDYRQQDHLVDIRQEMNTINDTLTATCVAHQRELEAHTRQLSELQNQQGNTARESMELCNQVQQLESELFGEGVSRAAAHNESLATGHRASSAHRHVVKKRIIRPEVNGTVDVHSKIDQLQSMKSEVIRCQAVLLRVKSTAIKSVFAKYSTERTRFYKARLFRIWKQATQEWKDTQAANSHRILELCVVRLGQWDVFEQGRRLFAKWKRATQQMATGDRLREYVRHIARRWMQRSRPDLSQPFEQWKRFTLFEFNRKQAPDSDKELLTLPAAVALTGRPRIGGASWTLNDLKRIARQDLQARLAAIALRKQDLENSANIEVSVRKLLESYRQRQVIDEEMRNERITSKFNAMDESLQVAKSDLRAALLRMADEKAIIADQTAKQIADFAASVQVMEADILSKLSDAKTAVKVQLQSVTQNAETTKRDINALSIRMNEQDEWNQNLLIGTVASIEGRQSKVEKAFREVEKYLMVYRNKIDGMSEELETVMHRATEQLRVSQETAKKNHDAQLFYDEELRWAKASIKEGASQLEMFQLQYDEFSREATARIDAIIAEEADDVGFNEDGSLSQRLQSTLMQIKKIFERYESWIEYVFKNSASRNASNTNNRDVTLVEALQFPEKQQENSSSADAIKLWNEMKRKVSRELTKCAKRVALVIATKVDQLYLSDQIKEHLLQITSEAGGKTALASVLQFDRGQEFIIVDTAGQVRRCERQVKSARKVFQQIIHQSLSSLLSLYVDEDGMPIQPKHTRASPQEMLRRRDKFINEFEQLVDSALHSYPLIDMDYNTLQTALLASQKVTQSTTNIPSSSGGGGAERKRSMISTGESSVSAQRRPSSAFAPSTRTRISVNATTLHNMLNEGMASRSYSFSMPALGGTETDVDMEAIDDVESFDPQTLRRRPTTFQSTSELPLDTRSTIASVSDLLAAAASRREDERVETRPQLSIITNKVASYDDEDQDVVRRGSPKRPAFPPKLEVHISTSSRRLSPMKTLAVATDGSIAPSTSSAFSSQPPQTPLTVPNVRVDTPTGPSFLLDGVSAFPHEDTKRKDPTPDSPTAKGLKYIPERFLSATLDRMEASAENYTHFTDTRQGLSSPPPSGYVVQHSSLPQQALVDALASNYAKDISIRAKHQEDVVNRLDARDVGLRSRPLTGKHSR